MIETALTSSIGCVRKTNRDSIQAYKNQEDIKMAVVYNGTNGYQGGDVVPTMVASHLGHDSVKADFATTEMVKKWLQVQLKLENETTLRAADHSPDLNGTGTTAVLAIRSEDNALIAHLGDLRVRLYSREKLTQSTEDHSLVDEPVKLGQVTKKQARNHPQKNIITQALGVSSIVNPKFNRPIIQENDIILLCTDGLTNLLEDDQIHQILVTKPSSLNDRCKKLITETSRLDGGDGITVHLLLCKANDKR